MRISTDLCISGTTGTERLKKSEHVIIIGTPAMRGRTTAAEAVFEACGPLFAIYSDEGSEIQRKEKIRSFQNFISFFTELRHEKIRGRNSQINVKYK